MHDVGPSTGPAATPRPVAPSCCVLPPTDCRLCAGCPLTANSPRHMWSPRPLRRIVVMPGAAPTQRATALAPLLGESEGSPGWRDRARSCCASWGLGPQLVGATWESPPGQAAKGSARAGGVVCVLLSSAWCRVGCIRAAIRQVDEQRSGTGEVMFDACEESSLRRSAKVGEPSEIEGAILVSWRICSPGPRYVVRGVREKQAQSRRRMLQSISYFSPYKGPTL